MSMLESFAPDLSFAMPQRLKRRQVGPWTRTPRTSNRMTFFGRIVKTVEIERVLYRTRGYPCMEYKWVDAKVVAMLEAEEKRAERVLSRIADDIRPAEILRDAFPEARQRLHAAFEDPDFSQIISEIRTEPELPAEVRAVAS